MSRTKHRRLPGKVAVWCTGIGCFWSGRRTPPVWAKSCPRCQSPLVLDKPRGSR